MNIRRKAGKKLARVPVVMQMEALECGAAALTMILAYFGKWIPLEEVRKDCGVSRDGSSAKNIVRAARQYGCEAAGYRYDIDRIRAEGTFPCIIHWNFNHFVVLCGFKGKNAVINDPAQGRYTVSWETFDKSFTGIAIVIEPGEDFVADGNPTRVISFVFQKLKGTASSFVFLAACTAFVSIIGLLMPALSGFYTDHLLTRRMPEWFNYFMLLSVILTIILFIVNWMQAYYTLNIEGKISAVSDAEYMWHVLRLPVEFYSQRMAGDVIERKRRDETITYELINTIVPILVQGAALIFYIFVMSRYSLRLTVVAIGTVVINLLLERYISLKRINLSRVASRSNSRLYSSTISGIEMIETIKATGAENGYFEKWSGYQAQTAAANVAIEEVNVHLGIIPSILNVLSESVIFMGAVGLCMSGKWTVGMITAFTGFLTSFMQPAQALISSSADLQEMRTDMERIRDVMEYKTDVDADEDLDEDAEYDKLSGKIEIKNVTFGYSRLSEPILKDFSMTIEPGRKVAFVGPSGCGKSTISKLISGLYKPWSGEILFDGKPIDQINRNVFRGSLSVVDQDIILFEDTIRNNIKMWDNTIEEFEMILAARDAHIHEDIMERPGGYSYRIREGGKDLSGGQKQRLEIARVLAEDPTIIIMDEATSALDASTEAEVVNSIKNRGITCLVIAHRLSTIRDCDEIVVLNYGQVVQRGIHDDLISQEGLYRELVVSE
ncbi:MAG: NHLP family bacteriocin export ABC transporter peptidase/permease/ATPase subunit [Lachnospiraceae bacterium]|nr:NHLP family bacteriocin export ABC transporter peptidase/permease/ATPase subunit [Lachnospiraceae bacterium]